MRVSFLLVAAAAVCAATASRVTVEKRTSVPAGWRMVGPSPVDAVVPLTFAVRQRNVDTLMEIVDDISTPKSPNFGKHLSLAELKELMFDAEAYAAVDAFVSSYDVLERHDTINQEFVSVKVTVAMASAMLDSPYFQWVNADGLVIHRVRSYSVPADVHAAIDFIGHTIRIPSMRPTPLIVGYEAAPTTNISTPAVIMKTYGITNNKITTPKATNAVFETIGQSWAPADLKLYDSSYNVPAGATVKTIGPNDPTSCSNPNNCIEAELDVQVITAIAQQGYTTFWSVPGSESFLAWIEAVAATANPPLVFSISYGEYEDETNKPQDVRFDTEVAKLGARGVSVLASSGDDGVAGSNARSGPANCGFFPQIPTSSPHITSVGATQGPEMGQPEIACQSDKGGLITSGGGFSNLFTQPSWQATAVSAYFANPSANLPPAGQFNATGRAYPDVALMGHNYAIAVDGQFYVGSGTSASSPLFASIVTLANQARILAGKSPLGFLNPILYTLASSGAFNDITSGENQCAAAAPTPTCCKYGFTATTGWDPVTGWGSINFPKFLAAVAAL